MSTQSGAVGLEFATIAVSDGISMGHEGMRASLVSRETIADSVELVMHAERFDGMVSIAGCDKSLPGMLMAAARHNLPSVFLYGGSSLPGTLDGKDISIVDVFEGIGAHSDGLISDERLAELEQNACPGAGSCAGMFTANTMASVGEAIGMSLPGSASVPAVDARLDDYRATFRRGGVALLEADIRPQGHHDPQGVRECHHHRHGAGWLDQLRAAPHGHRTRGGVDLTLEDFDEISTRTPQIGT